jgi:hypothetical protein
VVSIVVDKETRTALLSIPRMMRISRRAADFSGDEAALATRPL